MAPSYRDLYYNGELERLAKQLDRPTQLAEKLGVSLDALSSGLRRLRCEDESVPRLVDLFAEKQTNLQQLESLMRESGAAEQKTNKKPELEPLEEHRLKKKVRELEAENRDLLNQIMGMEDRYDIVTEALKHKIEPIQPEPPSGHIREGIPVFLLSDLHLEERVDPEKVNGLNEFNLEIARSRMTKLFEGIRWFIETQRHTFDIKKVCLWLGGDTFSNYLHPDNTISNLLAPPAAFSFARELIKDGLEFILQDDEIEQLLIPCNDGNHGRLTKDLHATTRTDMSLETLMYGILADDFCKDSRVQFQIARGDHLYLDIFNNKIRFFHGDSIRGGNGIAGIMMPILRAISKWDYAIPCQINCNGHFHQRISLPNLECNGSLIGYNPYAVRIGARYEEPTQSAFMLDSIRGKSVSAPIWVR